MGGTWKKIPKGLWGILTKYIMYFYKKNVGGFSETPLAFIPALHIFSINRIFCLEQGFPTRGKRGPHAVNFKSIHGWYELRRKLKISLSNVFVVDHFLLL